MSAGGRRSGRMIIEECPGLHHPCVHGASKYGIRNRLWRGIYDLIGVACLRRRVLNRAAEAEKR